jgi:hypothetical protein
MEPGEEGETRNWMNLRRADIVRCIKSRRMNWVGHVMRMEEGRIPEEY